MIRQESDAFSINFRIIGYLGFWRCESREKWKTSLYSVYRSVSVIGLSFFMTLQLMDLYVFKNDLRKFTYNLCGSSCAVVVIYKTYLTLFHMKRIEAMRKMFRENLKMADVGQDDEDHRILRKSARECMAITKVFFALVVPTVLCWSVMPLLDRSEEPFPLRIWLPLDLTRSPVYEIVYWCQVAALWTYAINVICVDVITYGFVIQICAQFEILAKNIRSVGKLLEDDEKWTNEQVLDERQKNLTSNIKKNLTHHQAILRQAKELEHIFNSALLVHMMGCSVLICVICFEIIANSAELNSQMFRQMGYAGCTLFDVFWYCFYGTQLAEKSLEVSKAVYGSPWYGMNLSDRKMLFIFTMRALKPPRITAGKLFPINLSTYLSVLQISYNMLAVLRQTSSH